MSFNFERATVTTTAALISTTSIKGEKVTITAEAANAGTIYIGRATVTSTTGIPLLAGQSIEVSSEDLLVLQALSSSGSQYLSVSWGIGYTPNPRTNGANLTSISDAGSFTEQTQVEAALQELYQHTKSVQAQIHIPLASAILAAGTPMAAFADNAASNPGITLVDSESVALRWNNNGTQVAVWFRVAMPQDMDDTAPVVLHALCGKTGATVGDATTLTVTAFFQTVAALHDADADAGGTSSALVGNATAKTVTELTLSIAHGDVPAAPCSLSLSVKPTDGLLGTDDFLLHDLWLEYTRKILTA